MAAYTSNQIKDYAKSMGWLDDVGNIKADAAKDVYQAAKNFGVSAEQIETAWGAAPGSINQWTQSQGLAALPATIHSPGSSQSNQGIVNTALQSAGITAKTPTAEGITGPTNTPNNTPADSSTSGSSSTPQQQTPPDYSSIINAAVAAAIKGMPAPSAPPAVQTVTPQQAQFKSYSVDPGQTNESIISRLVGNPNSPYLQRAMAIAREEAAGRGLLNSSIAAGAGAGAAIDAAGKIASQDANIYAQQNLQNQRIENDMAVSNADRQLRGDTTNADAKNTAYRDAWKNEADRSNAVLDTALGMADTTNKTGSQKELLSFGTDQDLRKLAFDLSGDLFKMDKGQGFDLEKMSAEQRYYLERLTTGLDLDLKKMAKGQEFDLEKLGKQHGYDVDKMRIALENDVTLSKLRSELDTSSRSLLMNLSSKLDSSLQGKSALTSATSRFAMLSNAIRVDPNLSSEEKEGAIDDLRDDWINDVTRIADIYDIELPAEYLPPAPVVGPVQQAPRLAGSVDQVK